MSPDICIDCNIAPLGPFAAIIEVLGTLGAILGWLAFMASGLPDFLQQLSQTLGFEGTSAGGAAYNTADDVGTGVAQGGLGTANDPPPPPSESPTTVPPPSGSGPPGIGQQLWDIVGDDLLNLGRQ